MAWGELTNRRDPLPIEEGPDPFFENHPGLNHRDVQVSVFGPMSWQTTHSRWIEWNRLDSAERLELERLLAKAASPFRPA